MRKKILTALLVLCSFPHLTLASSPKEFMTHLVDKALELAKNTDSSEVKEDKMVKLFKENVDTNWMAKFTVGKYFRTMTPMQQKEYIDLYTDYVIYSYLPKFREYTDEKVDINQVIDEEDGLSTVKSAIKTTKSSTGSALVDYKVKKTGDSYKVVDIIAEGVSLINTQRSDFSSPLAEKGVDYFLGRLADKVKVMKENVKKTPAKSASK